MNEKIKELAKQSGFYFYDLHNIDGQDYGETIEADNWNAAEKFAELIVQECVSILLKPRAAMEGLVELSEYNRGWVNGRKIGIEQIKDHFGIE